jgi:hypothetical protein
MVTDKNLWCSGGYGARTPHLHGAFPDICSRGRGDSGLTLRKKKGAEQNKYGRVAGGNGHTRRMQWRAARL